MNDNIPAWVTEEDPNLLDTKPTPPPAQEEGQYGRALATAEKYAKAYKKKQALEKAIKALEEKLRVLNEESIMLLDLVGLSNVRSNRYGGLYINRILRASKVGEGEDGDNMLSEACREAGLAHFIKTSVNANTISAYARKFDPENKLPAEEVLALLPAPLQPALKLYVQRQIRIIK